MEEYQKVVAGSPVKIHHKTWNACIDLVKAQKNQTASQQNGKREGFDHDPSVTELDTADSYTIFSMVGITGRITAHSEDLNEFLNSPLLEEIISEIKHFGILQRPSDSDVVETVTDGLSLCRVKLMQDPESVVAGIEMHRCTPSSGNWMYADTLGTHECVWHGSKVHDTPATDAGKGDTVWGIVRLGDIIQQVVHVQLNYKDGTAGPITTEGHYDAKLFHQDFKQGPVAGDVWLEIVSTPSDARYLEEQAPVFTGYFAGYDTRDNDDGDPEERPVIRCALCPTEKPFVLNRCAATSNGDPDSIPVTNKFCPTDIGKTVKIEGYESCYTIATVDTTSCPPTIPTTASGVESDDEAVARINSCTAPVCVTVLEIYDDCVACLCEDGVIPITICDTDPVEFIYANKLATTDEAVEVDLTEHKDEIVRLDDGRCGLVGQCQANPATDPPVDVVVLEFYPAAVGVACDSCLITKLVNCNDAGDVIYTFSDLTDYSDTDFIQKEGSDPLACYQKDHTEDPIEWTTTDPPVRFDAAPRIEFADCDECRGDVIYRLTHECTPQVCDPAKADVVEDIVTADTDLGGGNGKYFKIQGLVYLCAIDGVAVIGDITVADVDIGAGPFDTCLEALDAPMSGTIPPLRKVTTAANIPKWHINSLIFNADGQLTGVCPEVVTADMEEC